jgi:ribosomal protein L37AE/L43A
MEGRYGTDKLNTWILGVGVGACVIAMFLPAVSFARLVLVTISYILLIWAMIRTFSRNTYKRYQENRKFLLLLDRVKDREHRYFTCPRCRQPVRVPKGKGKIAITCPKCREKFVKKS